MLTIPKQTTPSVMTDAALFTEIFPIRAEALPRLYAYTPVFAGEAASVSGKLAYRLRHLIGGQWQWIDGRLITDEQPNPAKLLMVIDQIKTAHAKTFGSLQMLEEDFRWQPSPLEYAEFMVRGPLHALATAVNTALTKIGSTVKNAQVERECKAKAWTVAGKPAVSLSVVSRLIYEQSVMAYARTLDDPAGLIGLAAADKSSSLQGEIVKVTGTLADNRERLIGLSQRAAMRELLRDAADDSLVLRIDSNGTQYDYAADALALVVTFDTVKRFDVIPQQVERALQINASLRAQLVKVAADLAKDAGLLDNAFSEQNTPDCFKHVQPKPSIVWGGDKVRDYDREQLGVDFTKLGAWRFDQKRLRVTMINALDEDADIFMEALERELDKTHQLELEIVRERKVKVVSTSNLDSAIRALAKEDADALLAFFPDEAVARNEVAPHDQYLKTQTVARALPSLVLHASTLHKVEAMPQLIMGLMARAGGTPFAFEEPLPYADLIVGLATQRATKKDGEHVTALARLYSNRGVALGWRAAHAIAPAGAGLSDEMLAHLLPPKQIADKRVIVHVDGRLRAEDAAALVAWEEQHDAAIYPIEIVQRGNPRLYSFVKGRVDIPARGSAFVISEREALLSTSSAVHSATPQPLYVRALAPIKLTQALDSIMSLTLLHHGALQTPKLPVTISHADEWAEAVNRGVFPGAADGASVWWI